MVEALEVANLSKSFGGQRALADVSLSLGPARYARWSVRTGVASRL